MHQVDRDRTFAHGRGNAHYVPGTNILNRENRRQTGFEHLRRSSEIPFHRSAPENRVEIPSCQDESPFIQRQANLVPG